MIHAREDYNRIQDPAGWIPADEPVFLIRGQDITAPTALKNYADELRRVGGPKNVIEAVEKHAKLMLEWQANNGYKIPDMPEGA